MALSMSPASCVVRYLQDPRNSKNFSTSWSFWLFSLFKSHMTHWILWIIWFISCLHSKWRNWRGEKNRLWALHRMMSTHAASMRQKWIQNPGFKNAFQGKAPVILKAKAEIRWKMERVNILSMSSHRTEMAFLMIGLNGVHDTKENKSPSTGKAPFERQRNFRINFW